MTPLAIFKARMRSSRLSGKAPMPPAGRPRVLRQIDRLACCRRTDRLGIATGAEPASETSNTPARFALPKEPDVEVITAHGLYAENPAFTAADMRDFLVGRPDLARFGGDRRL